MYYFKTAVILLALATIAINFSSCTDEIETGNDLSGIKNELDLSKTSIETDFFYTEQGEKESFRIRKDKVIIKTKSNVEAKALSMREFFISAYDVDYIWVIASIDPKKTTLDDVLKIQEVMDATYALEYKDGTLQYPSDQIAILGKAGQSPEIILETAGLSKSTESIERLYSDSEIHLITVNGKLRDILQTCRSMYESDMCKFVEPVFFREMKLNNTHYSNQ